MSEKTSLIVRMADRYGVDQAKMLATLRATAFKGDVSNEQLMALLIVAEQHGLNPWTKEIYAFPDSRNGIVPVVGVDGWSRIINDHPQCNGIQFNEDPDGKWIECTIYRKDREFPTTTREWLDECKRPTQPWNSHPRRMLRHKALIQCARIAFSFSGIYDPDEAENIIDVTPQKGIDPRGDTSMVESDDVCKWVNQIADILEQDKDENGIAADLRELEIELNKFPELYMRVADKLAGDGVISKSNWKKYLKVGLVRDHAA